MGLGNPGSKYAQTRHNVGWMLVDRLADRAGISGRGRERDAAVSVRGRLGDLDVMLLKPLTFMNDSGIAVQKAMARERVPLGDVLVIVDDFALPFGRMRIRPDGTHGGHNGLRSIAAELHTQRFARLRVGIGEPRRDAIDHVLSRFSREEERLLPELLDAAADAVETWARAGAPEAANRWNAWRLPGSPAEQDARRKDQDGRQPAGDAPGSEPRTGDRRARESAGHDGRDGDAGDDRGPAADAAAGMAAEPEPGTVGGAAGPDGIVRTRTGWRRLLPGGGGERVAPDRRADDRRVDGSDERRRW